MGPGQREVAGGAGARLWLTHRRRLDPDRCHREIGVPVAEAVAPAGRVRPAGLPAATVCRAIYRGGYHGLAAAWAQLDAWRAAAGRTGVAEFRERDVVGPEAGVAAAEWRTELSHILAP